MPVLNWLLSDSRTCWGLPTERLRPYALEALADAYRYELRPFGIDSILVEPGIYRTEIFDRFVEPADAIRLADIGPAGEYAQRVLGVYRAAISAPDAPDRMEVAAAFVRLAEMEFGTRPFRTVVSAPIEQLLKDYNAAADGCARLLRRSSTSRSLPTCRAHPWRRADGQDDTALSWMMGRLALCSRHVMNVFNRQIGG